MRKEAERPVYQINNIPKECPFCGAKMEPLKMKDLAGKTVIYAYLHPTANCFLNGYRIYQREVEKWNRRSENG